MPVRRITNDLIRFLKNTLICSLPDGELVAVICIEDPLREEAGEMVRFLKEEGVSKIVMMTGDSERTAASIAKRVGVDDIIPKYFRKIRQDSLKERKRQEEK